MRISSLDAQNVGPFVQEKFLFQKVENSQHAEVHIFTGVNGSGKSTLLHALASMIDVQFIKNRFRYRDKRSVLDIGLFLESSKNITLQICYRNDRLSMPSPEPRPLEQYQKSLRSRYPRYLDLLYDFAVIGYSGSRTLNSYDLQAIQEVRKHPLEDAIHFQQATDPQVLLQWIANTKAKQAFAEQENNQPRAEQYGNAIARIEQAVEQIVGYPVSFQFNYEPLSVSLRVNGEQLEFDVLPDGLKSIISWIADLLMRLDRLKWKNDTEVLERSFILLLDEIEIHLHPAWQRKILPVIQKLFTNAQIFIATHSPFVVASVDDAWVYQLEMNGGSSRLAKVIEAKAGSSYPTVLDEIFGIEDYFDIETEKMFEKFYALRDQVLTGDQSAMEKLLNMGQEMSDKSVEVADIVGREMRQLERMIGGNRQQ